MIRILQIFSVLVLISASIVFALCANQWPLEAETEQSLSFSIVEKFKQRGSGEKDSQKTLSPLVKQAKNFALYLNPPEPPKPRVASSPKKIEEKKQPDVRPAVSTPKFTLIATSYYRSEPKDSMALVSEPGNKSRWVKQGENLGHFVVEKIESGKLVCMYGDQPLEIAVNGTTPVQINKPQQTMFASNQGSKWLKPPNKKILSASHKVKVREHKPLHRLGLGRPETRPAIYEQENEMEMRPDSKSL